MLRNTLTLTLAKDTLRTVQVSEPKAAVVHAKIHAYAKTCEIHAPVRFAENRISFFGA